MFTIIVLFIYQFMFAQNIDRAYRLIEKGELDKAFEILSKAYSGDTTKASVNLGLAIIFSSESFSGKNYFKAWQFILSAQKSYGNASESEKELMKQFLFNIEPLKNNWPLGQKIEYRQKNIENKLIKYVREEKDLEMVNEFIALFPNSKFYENVVHIRNYLEFGKASQENTIEAYNRFIAKFPDAAQVPEAIQLRNRLAFEQAHSLNTIQAYNDFLRMYPDASQVIEATHLRDELAFEEAKRQNTAEAYEKFVKQYPDALQVIAASRLYQKLIFEKARQINTFEAYSEFIRKFPEGEQFVDVFNLRSAALGNKYLSFNPELAGKIVWIRGFDQNGASDLPSCLSISTDGKITFAGSVLATEGSPPEAWVVSLDQEGRLSWAKTYPANKGSHVSAIQTTPSGDLILAGYTQKETPEGEIKGWMLKVNHNGFKYWDKEFDADEFGILRINKSSDILVAGYYYDSLAFPRQFIGTYKESGKIIWERRYTGAGTIVGMETGSLNEVYAAGYHWCIKMDPNGYILWESYTSSGDSILAMTTNNLGETVLLCLSPDQQLKLQILDKSGKKVSEKTYMSIPYLKVHGMTVCPSGDFVVFGSENQNAIVLKLARTGVLQKLFTFATEYPSFVADFSLVQGNNAIVLLRTGSAGTNMDAVVIKFMVNL